MNRRHFAAGMAAMIPATAMAQDATPDDGTAPRDVLIGYINAVIRDGDASAIADYFDGDALDLDAVTWDQANIRNGLGRDTDPVSAEITMALGDATQAIALARIWSNDNYARDVFIAVQVKDGKITGYRWMIDSAD